VVPLYQLLPSVASKGGLHLGRTDDYLCAWHRCGEGCLLHDAGHW
jgi:hypothetical protein